MKKQKQKINQSLPMFCELLCPTLPKDQAIEEKKILRGTSLPNLN
jgi:hypothetical protein